MPDFPNLEAELLSMLADDGAITRLGDAVSAIRHILSSVELSTEHSERLIHCGFTGEYTHGIGGIHDDYEFYMLDKADGNEDPSDITNMISMLVDCFKKPSQLSASENAFRDETAFDAIPRAIKDVTTYAEQPNSPFTLPEKSQLLLNLAQCRDSYDTVRKYADRCAEMALG